MFEAATMQATTVSNDRGRTIHVGCSGWVYKHWRGLLYPEGLPQKRWFERYAEDFDTVEINASFYRVPLASTFEGWREKAPAGFRYAVKVNRFITHMKKLLGCEDALQQFIDLARPLGPALGPLLYQLPPSLHKDLPRLEAFLNLLPTDLEHVFEFRHKSWYEEDVRALLDRYGVGFVAHDLKGLVSPRWASGRTAYVRFHGAGGKYWGRYSDEALLEWSDWILDQSSRGRSVWCYFNNDIHGHAIEDARTLKSMVGQLAR
ncbi:DUF72 domain-containing protein [Sphingomonas sp. SM33]|uniref:DUF72 domain-containing protein n=1 Tax=Sphingomonas telluris TaxID=2907998 RepID=A0ABS9VJM5_9SPHN|nr:DUF72 domain-containing protein [Sphingomonas telluris]